MASIPQLVHKLAECHLGPPNNVYIQQPKTSRQTKERILKTKAYDAIFKFLKGPHNSDFPISDGPHESSCLSELDRMYAIVYDLRCQRKFDDANKLEGLLEAFTNTYPADLVKSMCTLMLKLRDTGPTKEPKPSTKVPVVYKREGSRHVYPKDQLCYGDTSLYTQDYGWFLYYNMEMFEQEPVTLKEVQSGMVPQANIFALEPGQGLFSCRGFNSNVRPNDSYEKVIRQGLFGALVQSHTDTLDVQLQMPELNEYYPPVTRVPKVYKHSDEDEGYPDSHSGSSTDLSCAGDSGYTGASTPQDIWDLALNTKPSQHYVWERLGGVAGVTERPYVTEAGPETFDHLYDLYIQQLQLVNPGLEATPRKVITMATLVCDAHNVLLGVPSETFTFDPRGQQFMLEPGLCISGLSPEAVASASQLLMECGTHYCRLAKFAQPPVMDSMYSAGLVFQAFTGGLRKYLQHYRGCILSITSPTSLIQLECMVRDLCAQLRFLARLCKCSSDSPPNSTSNSPRSKGNENCTKQEFPTGIGLLSYLYDIAMETASSSHYPMMLSLLKASCAPYLVFVEDWVFHGVCKDPYDEFMIQVNDVYLQYRDKHYWTQGYVMTATDVTHSVPAFLAHMADAIFICGKSINLLRLCQPQHFLFTVKQDPPRVVITYSEPDLVTMETRCQMYHSRMAAVGRQQLRSQREMKERADRAKRELVSRARKAAVMEIERYNARAAEIKAKEDLRKKTLFNELKEQMEKDLRRRASEKEEEKEADKARMENATKQEVLEARVDRELEQRAREELIAYYERLSEEATYREQKALWRVRRQQLHEARRDFLLQDQDRLTELMDSLKDSPDGLATDDDQLVVLPAPSLDAHLPNWAKDRLHSSEPISVQGEDGDMPEDGVPSGPQLADGGDMPQWAKQSGEVLGLAEGSSKEDMPGWARKAVGDEGKTVVVEGEGEDTKVLEETTDGADGDKIAEILARKGVKLDKTLSLSPLTEGPKTHIKLIGDKSATMESEGEVSPTKATVRTVQGHNIHAESEEMEVRRHTKQVSDRAAHLTTTEEPPAKPHVKKVEGQSTLQQSEPQVDKRLTKTVGEKHVNVESKEEVEKPHLKTVNGVHANVESKPATEKIYKPSVYGHVSELAGLEYDILAPKMRRDLKQHASRETSQWDADYFGYQIKPNRRKRIQGRDVNAQSVDVLDSKPVIQSVPDKHASKESEYIDYDAIRLRKFQERNVAGHSSTSTVERLLYGEGFGMGRMASTGDDNVIDDDVSLGEIILKSDTHTEPYQDSYTMLKSAPMVDLLQSLGGGLDETRYGDEHKAHEYIALHDLLYRCVTKPLQTQISLVNTSVVSYFTQELSIDGHFEALRRYLLMEDGEFSHSLSTNLFEKLASNPRPADLLNPMYLNKVLSQAVSSSLQSDSEHTRYLSFTLKYMPPTLRHNAFDVLDCLELTYKVDWPVNIIITSGCLSKYSQVFSFMLQLKRAVWTLKDVWHQLKRHALIHKAGNSDQMRQLQLFRHEMQNFVKVLQSYIANQVIHVTWNEFTESLLHEVSSLDDLHRIHVNYLNKCLSRCLLNKKAASVMEFIQVIFGLILKLRSQLVADSWSHDPDLGQVTHPNFDLMCITYKSFNEYSRFLFRVVNKLSERGYQPHLQELLLRLNFNSYYKANTNW